MLMAVALFSPPWKDCRPSEPSLSTANLMLPLLLSQFPAIQSPQAFDLTRSARFLPAGSLATFRGERARLLFRVRDELPTRERLSPCAVQSSCGRHLATLKGHGALSASPVQVLCSSCPPLPAPSSLPQVRVLLCLSNAQVLCINFLWIIPWR